MAIACRANFCIQRRSQRRGGRAAKLRGLSVHDVTSPMSNRAPLAFFLSLALGLSASLAHADETVALKTVPTPDLSKLPPAQATELRAARTSFEKVREHQIGDALAETHALLGMEYARAGFYDAAAVALDDAIQLAPRGGRWLYLRGLLANAQRQQPAAAGFFQRAFAANANYLPIRVALAGARMEAGDLDAARTLLEPAAQTASTAAVPFAMLGDIALRQRRFPEAIERYKRALELDPQATRLQTQLAEAYTGAGDAKAAAAARAKGGDVAPKLDDPIGSNLIGKGTTTAPAAAATPTLPADPLQRNVAEALGLLDQKKYDAARQHMDTALKLLPNDPDLLVIYSRIEAASGNLVAAKTRADAAVAAGPSKASPYVAQGVVAEMSGDDKAAEIAYTKAIGRDAAMPEPRQYLGNLLMRTNRPAAAAQQYRELIKLDPSNGAYLMRLVAAQSVDGHCAEAFKDVNAQLAKQPQHPFLLELFVRLASTCPAARPEEKRMALDYATKLYRKNEVAPIAEAYALALGANGKWDDAVKTQEGAMFLLVRARATVGIPAYRETLTQLKAHTLPTRPWAASSAVFQPQRPQPDPKPAPVSAAPAKKQG